jgi:hypothetical protein
MKTITVKMTCKSSGSRTITCSNMTTLEEVARENGFADAANSSAVFISRGSILVPQFTLHAHQIEDGQTIIVHVPSNPKPRPARLPPAWYESKFASYREYITLEEIEADEASKAADQDFMNWEMSPSFPGVMRDVLEMIEAEDARRMVPTLTEKTVIAPSSAISETPLPMFPGEDTFWRRFTAIPICDSSGL